MSLRTLGALANDELVHFVDLAKQGVDPAVAGQAMRACRLAAAVTSYVPGLDPKARAGLKNFIDLVTHFPNTASEILKP